jgi:hypothetical protein
MAALICLAYNRWKINNQSFFCSFFLSCVVLYPTQKNKGRFISSESPGLNFWGSCNLCIIEASFMDRMGLAKILIGLINSIGGSCACLQ